jgi:hypothetical protein
MSKLTLHLVNTILIHLEIVKLLFLLLVIKNHIIIQNKKIQLMK